MCSTFNDGLMIDTIQGHGTVHDRKTGLGTNGIGHGVTGRYKDTMGSIDYALRSHNALCNS